MLQRYICLVIVHKQTVMDCCTFVDQQQSSFLDSNCALHLGQHSVESDFHATSSIAAGFDWRTVKAKKVCMLLCFCLLLVLVSVSLVAYGWRL